MTGDERKTLAEQLLANPLFTIIMDEMEADAIEAMIDADTEQTRLECQMAVQAARTFRTDCMSLTRSAPSRTGVVA
jgi:hypothetical protein